MSTETVSSATGEILSSPQGALFTKQALASDFLNSLYSFFRATESYDPSNQIFNDFLQRLTRTSFDWMHIFKFGSVELSLRGEQFFLNEKRIRPRPKSIKQLRHLSQFLRKKGITGFKIPKDSRKEDLNVFLWALVGIQKGSSPTQIAEILRTHGLDSYDIKTISFGDVIPTAKHQSPVEALFQSLFQFVKLSYTDLSAAETTKPCALDALLYDFNTVSEQEIFDLIGRKQLELSEHPLSHLAVLSAIMLHAWGKSLGLPPFVVIELAGCGLAHGLSVTHAPADALGGMSRHHLTLRNISRLKKTWPLTDLQLLSLLEFSQPFGERGVYEMNGRVCYQHFFSRMLRIVLVFNQMVIQDRRRKALTPSEAVDRLITENLGCDPALIKLFVGWVGLYPLGSFVKLTSGEIGQVTNVSQDLQRPFRPVVRLLKDREGNTLSETSTLDLSEINAKVGIYKQSIRQSMSLEQTGLSQQEYENLTSTLNIATY
jgi:hypothetical protein